MTVAYELFVALAARDERDELASRHVCAAREELGIQRLVVDRMMLSFGR